MSPSTDEPTARVISPAIAALFLAAFAVGTSELLIVGLLPTLASDLGVSIPQTGNLIGAYALGVAIGGPLLALATTSARRRPLIFVLMAIFIAGQFLCAFAPNYWLLMLGRVVTAMSHGLFFGVALVIATSLVPANRTGTVISFISAGVTVANLVGAPLGTAIGNAVGWRWAFVTTGALGLIAASVLFALITRGAGDASGTRMRLRDQFAPLGRQAVILSFATIAIAVAGYLAVFSFLVPLLTTVTSVPLVAVPLLLAALGVGAFFGNILGGRLGDWNPILTVSGSLLGTAAIYLVMPVVAGSIPLMAILLFVWALIGWTFVAPVQARILKWSSDAPNFVATLISSAFNVGIAAGAWIGAGALTQGWSYAQLPWLGFAAALTALLVTGLSFALERSGRPVANVVGAQAD